ncbi:MAG: class I SAM-dependent methyltransferase [Halioglobus sp.]
MRDPTPNPSLALVAASAADEARAAQLAARLGLPLLATGIDPARCTQADALLVASGRALFLQQTGRGAPGPVAADFGSAGMRYRSATGPRELVAKAVGLGRKNPLRVLDATAGLGRDAFVLADLGCELALCERHPVVVELLRAGLECAAVSGDHWLAGVAQRMRLYPGDARQLEPAAIGSADVIYLDPMFPRRSKSAAVKKEMAWFQTLLERDGGPQDAETLLHWALRQAPARVVVKRPARAPSLATLSPSHCITGKAVRYDVYVLHKLA